jgi:hypothetical protein
MHAKPEARIRRRVLPVVKRTGAYALGKFQRKIGEVWTENPPGTPPMSYTPSHPYDYGEYCFDYVNPGPPYLTGDDFKNLTIRYCVPGEPGVYGKGTHYNIVGNERYVGGFCPPQGIFAGVPGGAPNGVSSLEAQLVANATSYPSMAGWGDKGWKRTRPKLEHASGFVFGRELRDLPRMLRTTASGFNDIYRSMGGSPTSRILSPEKVADHFLNHQFGWAPFIKDLDKFHKAIVNSSALIDKITAYNGQWVRRKVTLRDETIITNLGGGNGDTYVTPNGYLFGGGYYTSTPKWFFEDELHIKVSAVGKFRYYRPEFDRSLKNYHSSAESAARHLTILGFRASPANIYRSTPWTWAIDWFTNVGDYVDHVNDILVDSIACEYFFVMQHQTKRRVFRQILPFKSGTVSLEFSQVIESKQRENEQSPFGFSLSASDLTPRQIAIIGALGLSRKGSGTGVL